MKKIILLFSIVLSLSTFSVYSQVNQVGEFLGNGIDNSTALVSNYFAPWTNSLGASLSSGWYNTAESHSTLGFDLTIVSSVAFVPDADKTFDLSAIGLTDDIQFTGETTAPTVAGEKTAGPQMTFVSNGEVLTRINSPQGTGVGIMGVPYIQIGLGIIKDTEITARFLPTLNYSGAAVKLWGVGIKHGVKQWIPVISKVPVLQLAVQGGYSKFNFSYNDISITRETYQVISPDPSIYDDQSLGFTVNSLTGNLLVGASLPVVHFYGGVGFTSTSSSIDFEGNIPIPTGEYDIANGEPVIEDRDGLSIEMESADYKKTRARVNIGMRIKLGVLTIHGDYTKAYYSTLSGGVGISFR